ncbi:MAG: hypothetical protein J5942_09260, partial [Prevotella sp.]|nr:hypothetical protein [Prevotella sp.]
RRNRKPTDLNTEQKVAFSSTAGENPRTRTDVSAQKKAVCDSELSFPQQPFISTFILQSPRRR